MNKQRATHEIETVLAKRPDQTLLMIHRSIKESPTLEDTRLLLRDLTRTGFLHKDQSRPPKYKLVIKPDPGPEPGITLTVPPEPLTGDTERETKILAALSTGLVHKTDITRATGIPEYNLHLNLVALRNKRRVWRKGNKWFLVVSNVIDINRKRS